MKILFAHGFEGSNGGTKPTYLRDTLGHEVIAPTMYGLGWTFEGHVQSVLKALDTQPDIRAVVGSSMGGFASTVALSRRPELKVVAVLLAPAIGIHQKWADTYGPETMERWAKEGSIQYWHRSLERNIDLPYTFWTQCRDAADVTMQHPCVIIHGVDDDVVPIANSEALFARSSGVKSLIKTDDGHRLSASLDRLAPALNSLTQ
jgi:pimeloyl-ACP methyl ester carboxylesterase